MMRRACTTISGSSSTARSSRGPSRAARRSIPRTSGWPSRSRTIRSTTAIPKGQYGGGTVQLWDRGYWIPEGDPHEGLKRGDLKFTLAGERLAGSWVLVRMKWDRTGGKRTNWLLIKHRDAEAKEGAGDAILKDPKSIASGRTLKEIELGKGRAT